MVWTAIYFRNGRIFYNVISAGQAFALRFGKSTLQKIRKLNIQGYLMCSIMNVVTPAYVRINIE